MPRIAVIGAGITGVTSAFELHRLGHDVTVMDRERYVAMDTSFANGGQLSASNAEVWNRFSTVLKGLKWLLRKDAPLSFNLTPNWHKASWVTGFLSAIPKYEANTIETTRMAIKARAGLSEMAELAGINFDWSPAGILHFYKSRSELDHARHVTGLLAKGGLERRELSAQEVRNRCPELRGDVIGGFWTQSDMTGDIHKFTAGLADWLAQNGVTFAMNTEVKQLARTDKGVEINGNAFDAVVICAGIGSRALAAELGDRVNIYPVKGYSITVNLNDATSQASAPTVSLLDDEAKIVTSRLGLDRFRIAGTAEFNGTNRDIRADRIAPLVDWCETHFPGVSTEHAIPWAGLRPMMPNMMPRVGAGRHPGVFYNTGHGHLGWTLSAATAAMLAASVEAQLPSACRQAA